MPPVTVGPATLAGFGAQWAANGGRLTRSKPYSSIELGEAIDRVVADSLAAMLSVDVVVPKGTSLLPARDDVVERGPLRVIGAVRPQNFDVGYRPDGVRVAFDSKTLNDTDSVGKNYQNMINDLATEATTVHARFPYAVVGFVVAVPEPCLNESQRAALVATLERLTSRTATSDASHLAEAIALLVWRPTDGSVSLEAPSAASPLRIERFAEQIENAYVGRYKGLPPHAA